MSESPVMVWREKLKSLQIAEAKAVDADQKFKLQQDIKEAEASIRKLEADSSTAATAGPKLPQFRADISRIDKYAPAELIGRKAETQLLDAVWDKAVRGETKRPRILTFVALGGEGKTSLVAKWAADLAHQDWPGCDAVFAWSFYSQGTREQTAASSELFLNDALIFFGDAAMAASAQGSVDKARRLGSLVGERRTLLILDGVEPLQYSPTSPMPGELKDGALSALLKALAASSHGLCVLTTRYSIPDLKNFWQTTAPEEKLLRLSKEAGVALLKSLGVKGAQKEFETLVEDVKGHALTLNLLGSYLVDAHAGDIRRRDLVKLAEANAEEQGGHAFHVMDAYVQWFARGGHNAEENQRGQRALALLQLLGLFDRPVSAECLTALLLAPAIPLLTEVLVDLTEAQRNLALTRLEAARLITASRDNAGKLLALDAHPLLREYFAGRLQSEQNAAWRAAHQRIYEHLCKNTKEGQQPSLEDLQPLYQAVAHGCLAGMQQEACDKVYFDRILRGKEVYSTKKLGAFGSDLGAVACFFNSPWNGVSPALSGSDQSWLLGQAAFRLRALGRLTEALEPMRAGLAMRIEQEDWNNAARGAENLSELALTLGQIHGEAGALHYAELAVSHADRGGDAFLQMAMRTTPANALHQVGRRELALARFVEAERMQAERQPTYPLLYSLQGYQYCDLLLAAPERAAWQAAQGADVSCQLAEVEEVCRAVAQRAVQTLQWAKETNVAILDIALGHLTLGCAALYEAQLGARNSRDEGATQLEAAVDSLRRASQQQYLPLGLVARAWLRRLTGAGTLGQAGSASAQADLDEAWEIAERGPMPLFLADIHLHRARLFGPLAVAGSAEPYPWDSPEADLKQARRLIEQHGYWRRKEELEDAEVAARNGWRTPGGREA